MELSSRACLNRDGGLWLRPTYVDRCPVMNAKLPLKTMAAYLFFFFKKKFGMENRMASVKYEH